MTLPDIRDRIRGGILGALIGDALGVPVEFLERDALDREPVVGMRGGGTWNQLPGTWSDDGAMTLVTADVLATGGWNPQSLMAGFHRWLYSGWWTARGNVFDVGRTTASAIECFPATGDWRACGLDSESSNGNGSLMRILPLSIWTAGRPIDETPEVLGVGSAVTHAHVRSRLCCIWHAYWCRAALGRHDTRDITATVNDRMRTDIPDVEARRLSRILDGSVMDLRREGIASDGYVISTLEAAVWCLVQGRTFEEVTLSAVNLGEDSDTTGAVAGGMAGWLLGAQAIPDSWMAALPRRDELDALIVRFTDRCLDHWSCEGPR